MYIILMDLHEIQRESKTRLSFYTHAYYTKIIHEYNDFLGEKHVEYYYNINSTSTILVFNVPYIFIAFSNL